MDRNIYIIFLIYAFVVNSISCAGVGAGAISIFSSNFLRRGGSSSINTNGISYVKNGNNNYALKDETNKYSNNFEKLNSKKFIISSNISNNYNNINCPVECICTGLSIDCSYKNIKKVPKNIPINVIKV
jgi:hypothetical protein